MIHIALVSVICIVNVLLGLLVLLSDRRAKVNWAFALFVSSIIIWQITDFLTYQISLAPYQVLLNRITGAAIYILILALVYFAYLFPKETIKVSRLIKVPALLVTLGLAAMALFTDLIVKDAPVYYWGSNLVRGEYFYVFGSFITLMSVIALTLLIVKWRRFEGLEKEQIKIVLIGIGLWGLFNFIFNFTVPLITGTFIYGRIGSYSTILFIGFTAYALVKYRLFNVRIVATELLMIGIVILLLYQLLMSNTVGQIITTSALIIVVSYLAFKFLRTEVIAQDVAQILRNYSNPSKLENSSFLKLNIVRRKAVNGDLIRGLQTVIREAVEYYRPRVNPNLRTKANLKYHFLRMYTYDHADEGQILWELGFEGYPMRIFQATSNQTPRFVVHSKSPYQARSKNVYNQLKQEAFRDVEWAIKYLSKQV